MFQVLACNVECACWVEVLYTRGCWVMQGAAVTDMCKCLEEVWIQDTCPSVSTHTTVQDSGGNKVYLYSSLVHFGLCSHSFCNLEIHFYGRAISATF